MAPYATNQNQAFVLTANALRGTANTLRAAFEASLKIEEKLTDLKPGQPLGPWLTQISRFQTLAEDGWKSLAVAVSALSLALVDENRQTPDDKLAYLLVTGDHRRQLLATIKQRFGEVVMAGNPVGLGYPKASAALVVRFLQSGYQTADGK